MRNSSKAQESCKYALTLNMLYLFIVCVVLLLPGCSQPKLSRDEAEKMIKAKAGFPTPVPLSLELCPMSITKEYERLQQEGMIKYQRVPATGIAMCSLKVELAEAGRKYYIRQSGEYVVQVKGCERKFLKVTEITPLKGGTKGAEVDFEWIYDNMTPFRILSGQGIMIADPSCQESNTVHRDTVTFALNDDGWMITQLPPLW